MKKFYFHLTLIATFMVVLASTHLVAQDADNYYTICKKWDQFYDSLPSLKVEEDGGYAQYLRWKDFWRTRVCNGDSASKGNFEHYQRAVNEYSAHLSAYQKSSIVFSDWHSMGPFHMPTQNMGQVCAVYVDTLSDKTMKTIYVGTNASGLWRTMDGGANWNNISDNASWGNGLPIDGITDITGDHTNPNVLYITASSGYISSFHNTALGALRSQDAGRTWTVIFPKSPDKVSSISKIIIDPNHIERIFIAADTAVYRSLDGGSTWTTILRVPRVPPISNREYRYVRNIVIKPGNADTIYAATDCNHWAGHHLSRVFEIYNPINNPSTINVTDLTNQLPLPYAQDTLFTDRINVAVTAADPDMIYVACNFFLSDSSKYDSTRLCLWRYWMDGNHNGHWTLEIDSNGIQNGINVSKFELLVSPADTNVVYIGNLTFDKFVYYSGAWHLVHETPSASNYEDPYYHVDTRASEIISGSTIGSQGANDVIFCGNDGGLSKTINGSSSWKNLDGNGLSITQFYGVSCVDAMPDLIIGGSQDNSGWRDSTNTWYHIPPGDWGDPVIDPIHPNYVFNWLFGGGTSGPNLSSDFGKTWNNVHMDTSYHFYTEPKANKAPLIFNPGSETFYMGSKNLYRSYNLGTTFQKFNPTGTASTVGNGMSNIGISQADTNVIYISYEGVRGWWDMIPKFMRSNNYGVTWKDMTDSVKSTNSWLQYLYAYQVTGIAVKSTDPKTLWISLDGFWSPYGDSAKVLVSHNGGATWTNYSKGLPNFPINTIKYMNNSNDRLFVGTDVGVLYIDNTLNQWQPFNNGMPLCVVEDLEVLPGAKELRAGTFGRGLWETTLDCEYYPSNPIVIHRDTTWNTNMALNTDVYIDSSFTLTIRGKVSMPPLAKIFVKQGGCLYVNGGTITNKCANMWQGIEVWGRTDKNENRLYQGLVRLDNGAVIENARIGITTSRKNGSNFNASFGGIISARNATFRNNYKAVEFYGNDKGQQSRFTRVNFETTGPFVDGTSTPSDFVSMLGVKGVCFYGCNFRNTTIPQDSIPNDLLAGRGIFSVNSMFHIDEYDSCSQPIVPCPNPIRFYSTFNKLYYGIRSLNTDPVSLITINGSVFNGNFRGIYISGVDQPQVTKSSFYIPYQSSKNDTIYGLYLAASTGYKIQENFFKSPGNSLKHPGPGSPKMREIGIIVDNSGRLPNEIYNNAFDSLDFAINAQRLNKDENDSTGLVLKCNRYLENNVSQTQGNSYDQVISRMVTGDVEGIAVKQGARTQDRKDPAGNRFSPYHANPSTGQIPESDIKNGGENFIYFYHSFTGNIPRVYPDYATTAPSVTRTPTYLPFDSTSCCPSKLNNGGIGNPSDLMEAMTSDQQKIDSLSTVLNSLVDGGNTTGLTSEVYFSVPPDSSQVQVDLLSGSPYLSDTVMKSAIDKESVFNNGMVRDVLVANPQAAKSNGIMDELNSRIDPMPEDMMDQILAGKDSLSSKEALEAQISTYKLDWQYQFDELVRHYKSDTVSPESCHDSLMQLLASVQNPKAQYMLAFEYYYLGDWENANQVLEGVQNLKLSDQEEKERDQMVSYFAFLKNLSDNGRNIYSLDYDDINSLNDLLNNSSGLVNSYCLNLLQANNQIRFYEPILIPEDDKKSAPVKDGIPAKTTANSNVLRIYPSPANLYVIAEYSLAVKESNNGCVLTVTTSQGKAIWAKILTRQQDKVYIDTKEFSSGLYVFSLKTNGKTLSTGKITIIH